MPRRSCFVPTSSPAIKALQIQTKSHGTSFLPHQTSFIKTDQRLKLAEEISSYARRSSRQHTHMPYSDHVKRRSEPEHSKLDSSLMLTRTKWSSHVATLTWWWRNKTEKTASCTFHCSVTFTNRLIANISCFLHNTSRYLRVACLHLK